VLENRIYNYNFKYARTPDFLFPDGWLQVGGSSQTLWQWEKRPDGTGKIKIINPTALIAGIRLEKQVYVSVGEWQRWLFKTKLFADTSACTAYVRIYFSNPAGYPISSLEFQYTVGFDPTEICDVVATPQGATAILVEVGIIDLGTVTIEEVFFGRLYPLRELRLDGKGRLFVNNVNTVNEIIKPVPVKGPIDVNPVKIKGSVNVNPVEIKRPIDVNPVKIKGSVNVNPVEIKGPIDVHVKADVTADIRSLNYIRDSVRVFGSEGAPLKTSNAGNLQVENVSRYTSEYEIAVTKDAWERCGAKDVSRQRVYSYAVLNTGTNPATVRISISPDSLNWLTDSSEIIIAPGEMQVLTAKFFLHYISMEFRSVTPRNATTLKIWFQAKT
jgi:hypothetical protein